MELIPAVIEDLNIAIEDHPLRITSDVAMTVPVQDHIRLVSKRK